MDKPGQAVAEAFNKDSGRKVYTREIKFDTDVVKNVRESAEETPFPFFLHLKPLNSEQREVMKGVHEAIKRTRQGSNEFLVISGSVGRESLLLLLR